MTIIDKASFSCIENGSDKVYHVELQQAHVDLFSVRFSYGRRGSALQFGCKVEGVSGPVARKAFDKVCSEKLSKGYVREGEAPSYTEANPRQTDIRPQLLNAIDEVRLKELLKDDDWIMQEKMDGRNITIVKTGDDVVAINRKGQVVSCPTAVVAALQNCQKSFRLAGEMVGEVYYAFDLIALGGTEPDPDRRFSDRLDDLLGLAVANSWSTITSYDTTEPVRVVLGYRIRYGKKAMYLWIQKSGGEGVVFKDANAKFTPGRPSSGGPALKYKFCETATCRVGGNYTGKRSVELYMPDGEASRHVGNVTIPPNYEFPDVGQRVEIRYLHAFHLGSLYQPVYLGVRGDKDEADDYATLKFKDRNVSEEGEA